ncbi:MAG: SLBB domain-containing protein [Ignavibacteriae bacterium]|nr:SLBB domain-containing protein [Ignavibacteriota bacterium]
MKKLYQLEIFFFFIVSQILFSSVLLGQSKQLPDDILEELEKKNLSKKEKNALPTLTIALEGTINPDSYIVGPSDVFSINLWLSPPVSYTLTVTPEGTVIIPSISEIHIATMSLNHAKKKIIAEVRKKYISGDVTVTLIVPRSVVVTVTGNVQNQGKYTINTTQRADMVIKQAIPLENASQRNIILSRKDGTKCRIDIQMYYATQDDKWNPYLREGDVIVVQRITDNFFSVYGAVNQQGKFEYIEGDNLADAISLTFGFSINAKSDGIELYVLDSMAKSMTVRYIDFHDFISENRAEIQIASGTCIVVRKKIENRNNFRVQVQGEVLYPGYYPITKNQTRLSEIIQQAGGFTEFASLKSAELIHQTVQIRELEVERLLSLRGGASVEDSTDYFLETELRLKKEIVNVDFEKLFLQNDTLQDIILQTEDQIYIPSKKQTIYVFGQVVSPGHIPYVKGNDFRYYISKAGGFTERAREADLKIIKARTKQWLAPDETEIEEGDYIWIPKTPERTFEYYATVGSQVASVLGTILALVVTLGGFK